MSGRDDAVHAVHAAAQHRETTHEHEHEFEAAHGLPEALPEGEHVLWQGAPEWRAVANRCFHVRTLGWYFAAILVLRAVTEASQTGSLVAGLVAAAWLVAPAAGAIAMLWFMAWLTSRTTVYTITNRRVVMRIGIVLSLTFNLPFARIRSADARPAAGTTGDIALALTGTDKIAYVHLWPHARPWRLARPEPMLRCVENLAHVAGVLTTAWRAANGMAPMPTAAQLPVQGETLPRPALASPLAPSFAHAARRLDGNGAAAAH